MADASQPSLSIEDALAFLHGARGLSSFRTDDPDPNLDPDVLLAGIEKLLTKAEAAFAANGLEHP